MGDCKMVNPHFSIVIPTHNRAAILRRSLGHLLRLPGVEHCEIVIVDDGSSDDTPTVIEEYRRDHPTLIRCVVLSNGGPARARNHGVKAARLSRILFIDDDVFPRPGMLQQHWDILEKGYVGSQGILVWHPDIEHTELIRYIDSCGSQFAFDRIKNPHKLGFQYVYTGNFATHRDAVLDAGGFDESFYHRKLSFSAYEDTILGYRLTSQGGKLAFNSNAIADHLHNMTVNGFLQREYKVGFISKRLMDLYPEIARRVGVSKNRQALGFQASLLASFAKSRIAAKSMSFRLWMRLRHREAFLRGLYHAHREG
jgi:glycosyltransferase involved in cell wall biosynthesis